MNEKFEDTKGLIRSRKSKKDRQHNDQKKKDRQHNDQKNKDRQHNGQTNKTIIYKILHNVLFKRLLKNTIMNLQH